MAQAVHDPAIIPTSAPRRYAIRENAIAGVVVGVIAIPLSIALSVAVGAPPIAGLYTAVFAGAVAAMFGGSNYNITGPTAALVPVLAHAAQLHGPDALPLLALLAGSLLLAMSALRAGQLVRLIPGTVIVGFTAGIALSIAFGQLNNFFAVKGTDGKLEHFHEKFADTIANAGSIEAAAPLLGVLGVLVLLATPRIKWLSRAPGPLVAVVVVTALAWRFDIDVPTLASTYGDLPTSFPAPDLGFLDAELAFDLLPLAVSVAVLAGIESLLSAVVADGMSGNRQPHDPTRELRGQGFGNLAAALFGGIPATAAIARTGAGIRSGGTNRLTGVFHALTVLAAILVLGGLAGHVPLTALAAILMVIAWRIADAPEVLRLARRAPREDALIVLATMLVTLFFDITLAVGFGMLASAGLLIRRMMKLPAARELLPDETGRIRDVSPELSALIQENPHIAFFTASELLSFHSAAAFEYGLAARSHDPLVLRMKDVHHVDATGLLRLEGIIEHRIGHGNRIVLTAIQPQVRAALERFGIIEKLGRDNVFEHTRDAIAALNSTTAA